MKNKKKKVIARIGAILACVLLVGSLAIPAFAFDSEDDTVIWPPPPGFRTNYLEFYLQEDMYNSAYIYLEWFIHEEIYIRPALASGTIVTGVGNNTRFTSIGETNDIVGEYIVDYSFYPHGDNENNVVERGILYCKFLLNSFVVQLADIDYHVRYTFNYTFTYQYGFAIPELTAIYDEINGQFLDLSQTYYLAIAFTQTESNVATLIADIMFGDTGGVVYPRSYYEGFSDNYTLVYQEGYNQGIDDAGSGAFGKNLLGSIFSAPFEALSNFTLIEWTTDAGATISISLATIISAGIGIALFIWFLKLFAGG